MRVNPGELILTDHGRIASVLPNWQLFQVKLALFFKDEQLLPDSLSQFGKTDAPYLLAYSATPLRPVSSQEDPNEWKRTEANK